MPSVVSAACDACLSLRVPARQRAHSGLASLLRSRASRRTSALSTSARLCSEDECRLLTQPQQSRCRTHRFITQNIINIIIIIIIRSNLASCIIAEKSVFCISLFIIVDRISKFLYSSVFGHMSNSTLHISKYG